MKPQDYVGGTLIGAAAVLFVVSLTQIEWSSGFSVLSLIPLTALLVGLLVIPGIIIRKQRGHELAGSVSGALSFSFYILLTTPAKTWEASLKQGHERDANVALLGLLIVLLPVALAMGMHRFLKPKLETWFTAKSRRA